ncbi:unnamed protein product [Brachionus calyciflorus]|uniref:WW domain-containing oxidoreductase n=1 Tax=Brachionus calyciflorus TaxID=104777 RepID=A0A813MYP5_9BILA|nr:unnamed protein product [Brachionus calyciflorus]
MSGLDSIIEMEEDNLPEGWEERVTPYGKVYYANHLAKMTQWEHPISGKQKYLSGELPYGWERKILDDGTVVFVDEINQKKSYTDPRLAFSKHNSKMQQTTLFFNENLTALDLIKNRDLTGFYAIVIGANRGVGYEIVKALAFQGCYVIMACRNLLVSQIASDSLLREKPGIKIEVLELNLDSLISVKNFADKILSRNLPLHMLFLNAAIFETEHKLSRDNIELMFQVNYLAQFYLARLLMRSLIRTENSRLVILTCESHRGGNLSRTDICSSMLNVTKSDFNCLQVYCNTKLCNLLFANEMNRRLNKNNELNLICKSCHPGNMLPSKLFWNWLPFRCLSLVTEKFSKSLAQAAACPVMLATENFEYFKNDKKDSFYWNSSAECNPSEEACDSVLAYRLWEISEAMLIEHTSSFDDYLSQGDQFSSYTKTSNNL